MDTNPTPRFSGAEWSRVLDQLGYGIPDGPLWLLGMEEALPGDVKADPQLPERVLRDWLENRRLPFGSFEDFNIACVSIPSTPTWKIMAKLARLLLQGATDWASPYPAFCYIGSCLGRSMGETLLLELLPLPAPSIIAGPFLYSELFPGGRKEYETSILPRRIKTLRYLVETYRPRFVICYGRTNWQRYRELFDLHDEPEQLIAPRSRAVVGRYGETVVALTPFFDDPYFPHTAIKAVGERIIAAQQEMGRRGQGVS